MGKEQIPLCICPLSDRELRFGKSACVAATGVFIPKTEIPMNHPATSEFRLKLTDFSRSAHSRLLIRVHPRSFAGKR
jgi:hypothetical protein